MSTASDTEFAPSKAPNGRTPWFGLDATDPAVVWCATHEGHRWTEVRVGDVKRSSRNPDERMVFCARCYAPRCGHTTDPDPCLLPRHHRTDHAYQSGRSEPVGGIR